MLASTAAATYPRRLALRPSKGLFHRPACVVGQLASQATLTRPAAQASVLTSGQHQREFSRLGSFLFFVLLKTAKSPLSVAQRARIRDFRIAIRASDFGLRTNRVSANYHFALERCAAAACTRVLQVCTCSTRSCRPAGPHSARAALTPAGPRASPRDLRSTARRGLPSRAGVAGSFQLECCRCASLRASRSARPPAEGQRALRALDSQFQAPAVPQRPASRASPLMRPSYRVQAARVGQHPRGADVTTSWSPSAKSALGLFLVFRTTQNGSKAFERRLTRSPPPESHHDPRIGFRPAHKPCQCKLPLCT